MEAALFLVDFHHFLSICTIYALLSRFMHFFCILQIPRLIYGWGSRPHCLLFSTVHFQVAPQMSFLWGDEDDVDDNDLWVGCTSTSCRNAAIHSFPGYTTSYHLPCRLQPSVSLLGPHKKPKIPRRMNTKQNKIEYIFPKRSEFSGKIVINSQI